MATCPIPLPVLFTVPGVPVPKGRPRVTRAGITYTPRETLNYEAQVRVAYAGKYPGREPIAAHIPLRLILRAFFPLPASVPKRLRQAVADGRAVYMPTRPDLDNLVKVVLDALNKVAWADDGQVVLIQAVKLRTAEQPRLIVRIDELPLVEEPRS